MNNAPEKALTHDHVLMFYVDNQMEKNESEIPENKLKGCTDCREGSCSYFDFPSYQDGTPGASPDDYIPGQRTSCTQHNTKQKYRKEIHSESHSQFTILNFLLFLIQSLVSHTQNLLT